MIVFSVVYVLVFFLWVLAGAFSSGYFWAKWGKPSSPRAWFGFAFGILGWPALWHVDRTPDEEPHS